jgi:hypothetical protein
MSQRIYIESIDLKDLAGHFGSKSENTLRRVADHIQRQSGKPILDIHVNKKPQDADEYDYNVFVAARKVITGEIVPGENLAIESQELVNAILLLADLQGKDSVEMEGNGDWKNYASIEYQEAMASQIDPDINKLLSYLANGRPFFAKDFGSADEHYSYLTLQEVMQLCEYMRTHSFMKEDEAGFGHSLFNGLQLLIKKEKDLWLTVS